MDSCPGVNIKIKGNRKVGFAVSTRSVVCVCLLCFPPIDSVVCVHLLAHYVHISVALHLSVVMVLSDGSAGVSFFMLLFCPPFLLRCLRSFYREKGSAVDVCVSMLNLGLLTSLLLSTDRVECEKKSQFVLGFVQNRTHALV